MTPEVERTLFQLPTREEIREQVEGTARIRVLLDMKYLERDIQDWQRLAEVNPKIDSNRGIKGEIFYFCSDNVKNQYLSAAWLCDICHSPSMSDSCKERVTMCLDYCLVAYPGLLRYSNCPEDFTQVVRQNLSLVEELRREIEAGQSFDPSEVSAKFRESCQGFSDLQKKYIEDERYFLKIRSAVREGRELVLG